MAFITNKGQGKEGEDDELGVIFEKQDLPYHEFFLDNLFNLIRQSLIKG